MAMPDKKEPSAIILLLVFVILSAGIITTGYVSYRNYEKHHLTEVERQLSAIAELKAEELAGWRKERLGDASVFYKNDNFSARVRQYLKTPGDPEAQTRLRTWISQFQAAYEYDRIFLLDTKGVERMSVPDKPEPVAPDLLEQLSEIMRSRQVTFLDFHRDRPDQPIHLAIMVPVLDGWEGGRGIGLLVFRIDPQKYLYPFINRWPIPSRTAETLLVRREGNEVVFLNELRFQKNTALNLRIPLEKTETPAVQAALGHQGIVEGKDHLGAPVIAYVRSVPDSPWFLIARMDISEVYAPLRERLWIMVFLIGALLIGAGAVVGLLWRHQSARYYLERYEASEALLAISSRQEAILSAVPDIIMEVDSNKVYTWANQAGREFFGEDVIGREAVFYFEGEQDTYKTVKPLFNGKENVIYIESWQRRKDGQKRLLAWWCRVLKDNGGNVTGALSTARDITEGRRAEEEKQRILNLSKDLICIAGMDGYFKYVSPSWERTLGYTREEMLSRPFLDFIHPDDHGENDAEVEILRAGKDTIDFENRYIHKDGPILTISWVATPLVEERLMFCIGRDITERKQAADALRESEERFRMLVESAPEAIFVQSQGFFVYINPTMLRLLGASTPEELLGKEIMERMAPEYHGAIRERIRMQHETGKPAPLMEQEYLRLDGSRVPVETTAVAVRFQDRDAYLVFVRDITERKRAEEELRKLSRAVEQSPTSVMITDLHGDIEYVNPKFTDVTGFSFEEVRGKNPRILKSGETPPVEYQKLWKTITSGGEWHGVFHNKSKDGTLFWERASISAVHDSSGAITHFIAIKEDITNQKSLEDQLLQAQKLEAVGQLAGGIAHDFNNILTAIIGYGHIIKMKMKEDDPLRTYAEQILLLSDKAANLTQSLLSFSRKRIMNPEPVTLNEIIKRIDYLLSRIIGEDIRLQTILSEEDLIVMADQGHIEQVLMNLATNARDSMPEGGRLSIGTEKIDIDDEFIKEHGFGEEGAYALIAVTDTGAGMDRETREKIFEPFFTTKEVGKGTGLGLSMVYGIIKQHEGYINVYSEPGIGTTFRIYLPLIEGKVEEIKPEVIQTVERGTETVLLAEDETEVKEFTKKMLEEYGYKVITAGSGQEAINEFKAHKDKIQLLLFDVIMPNKNGREAYEEIKKIRPDIRALFMSGYPADIINKHGILEKGFAYIEKPASPTKLLKKIKEVLGK
jgi:PAS domain S-box-containing protein